MCVCVCVCVCGVCVFAINVAYHFFVHLMWYKCGVSQSGIAMPPSRHGMGTYPETAHTQLAREHSAIVISAH